MKLLLTGAFSYTDEQLSQLADLGYEFLWVQDEREPLRMDVSDIKAVVCNALFQYNDIRKFRQLEFIQLTSAGVDRVPLEYIERQNIRLFSAKGVYSIPVAEWVVHKILEIYKRDRFFHEAQKNRSWVKRRDILELTGKTAAVIGFGDIGHEVAKRLRPFGVRLIGVGRTAKQTEAVDEFYVVDELDRVLEKSDIVILTLPLTRETKGMINAARIKHMRDGCVLINVSRGQVICEEALVEAVRANKFLGVALDVFAHEPLPEESPLWSMEDVIITPHISHVSEIVGARLFSLIMENLTKYGPLAEGGLRSCGGR